MSDSLNKLTSMNLDPVGQFLAPYYSNTGRPAINQPQILRSFILMLDRGFTRLTNWIAELASDDLLAILIGCAPDSLPPLGSYFDFINRLWLQNPSSQKSGRKDLFPENKNKKPSSKPGKGKKLPNRHPGITKKLLLILNPDGFSLFIMKNSSSSSFLSLPLSLLWNLG